MSYACCDSSHSLGDIFPWSLATTALEEQGWFIIPDLLPKSINSGLLETFLNKLKNDQFDMAKVGRKHEHSLEKNIRLSETSWIEQWESSEELKRLNEFFKELSCKMNQHFFLSIKRWESQMAFYPNGGFYRKHLDQLKNGENRLMTCIFYLNDCDDGGELIIYDRSDIQKKAAVISPRKGSCILFFSGQIFHEVKSCYAPRYSLTTWLRHDQDPFFS